jgi:ABC-type uncharacterized transport system permease subunit
MTLTGSRSTLTANVCALVVASVVIAEGAYIVHEVLGYYLPQDAWAFLFPALVMFIIRNRIFSYCFLGLYVLLSIQMFFQARSIHLGTYGEMDRKIGPLVFLPFLFFLAAICLALYTARALAGLVISKINSRNN